METAQKEKVGMEAAQTEKTARETALEQNAALAALLGAAQRAQAAPGASAMGAHKAE
jgi:hypothetical protein